MKRIKLGEIIERLIHGGTPSLANESFWIGNIPWITGADFVNQKVVNIRRYISAKALKFTATNLIAEGDLLLVTRTGVGKMAIAPCDIAISQDITGITFDQNAADTEFMYYLLQGKTDHFLALNQGTSINGITREDLLNLEIEIPSKQEQIKIVDVASTNMAVSAILLLTSSSLRRWGEFRKNGVHLSWEDSSKRSSRGGAQTAKMNLQ